jgi:hypothetical protein
LLVGKSANAARDQEIDIALMKVAVQLFGRRNNQLERNTRMAPGQSVDDRCNETCSQERVASDAYFASFGI